MFPKFEKESKQFIVCFVFPKKKKKDSISLWC